MSLPLSETGPDTEVLAGQLRLATRILDALKTSSALVTSGANAAIEPSSEAYLKATAAYEKSDPEVSIVLYRRALELNSMNTEAKLSLALAYLSRSDAEEALKVLKGGDVDGSAPGQMLRSSAFAFLNDWEKAMDAINRAIKIDPQQDVCYWWRGRLLAEQEQYAAAFADFERAMKLDPNDPDYYQDTARVNEELGKYDRAAAVLESGRNQLPEDQGLRDSLNDTRRRAAVYFLSSDHNDPNKALGFALAAARDDQTSEGGHRLAGIAYASED